MLRIIPPIYHPNAPHLPPFFHSIPPPPPPPRPITHKTIDFHYFRGGVSPLFHKIFNNFHIFTHPHPPFPLHFQVIFWQIAGSGKF